MSKLCISKNSDRTKVCMGEDWFGDLMWILQDLQPHIQQEIDIRAEEQDQEGAESYRQDLRENIHLVNKIIKDMLYEKKPDGHYEVCIEFSASETQNLIWQFILFSTFHTPKNAGEIIEECIEKHEAYKAGERIPIELVRLYQEERDILPCRFTYDFDAAVQFKRELEKEIPGVWEKLYEKLTVAEVDKLIDLIHDKTIAEISSRRGLFDA